MKERPAGLSISLPPPLRKYVQQRVRTGGFGNVSDYIRSLIRADQAGGKTPPLPGLGGARLPPKSLMVRDGTTTAPRFVDFTAEDWRELRAALAQGENRLMSQRLAAAAPLWRDALQLRRASLRREQPQLSEEELDAQLAAELQQMAEQPDDPFLRPNPERLARPLHD